MHTQPAAVIIPESDGRKTTALEIPDFSQRFIERFLLSFSPEPMSGCWLWLKSLTATGYGQVKWLGLPRKAHRVSYLIFKGPIPGGLPLDHLCRTPCCINPDHLEPVTNAVNVRRGLAVMAYRASRLDRIADLELRRILDDPRLRSEFPIIDAKFLPLPEVHPCAQ